ncbi:MAG TPA: chemotaxis protein CheW [Geobacteraceae bacterium]
MTGDIQDIQIACFRLGDDVYAVDIMRIKEIIRPQKLTNLPKAPSFVDGVINLRGSVVPVIDLRKRFDLPPRATDQATRLLIVKMSGQSLGLVVDDVTEVITIPLKDIKPPPQVVKGVGGEYLVGVCLARESLIMLLNLDKLLTVSEANELGLMNIAGKERAPL